MTYTFNNYLDSYDEYERYYDLSDEDKERIKQKRIDLKQKEHKDSVKRQKAKLKIARWRQE